MDQLSIEELPYSVDSSPLFAALLDLRQPIYLDSSASHSTRGRYDILTAEPLEIIKENNYISASYEGNLNYFIDIQKAIQELTPDINNDYHLPFIGGAVGCFGYDLGRQLEQLSDSIKPDLQLPIAQVGIYSWAVIVDHRQHRTVLVAHPHSKPSLINDIRLRLKEVIRRPPLAPSAGFTLASPFKANMSREDYSRAFDTIQDYITAGDCYQVNLAQRFSADFQGDPWAAYLKLRATAAAPFSAYMKFENTTLLSLSPERFLQSNNQRVTTSPIKGTIARGNTPQADNKLAQQLLHSAKDMAENLMIVDLLRNDLGKCCQPGSIQVDQLFELQSFETVHHLVSTISGQLKEDCSPLELLASCFPGGSITGAPKIRAMQIIEELEPHRRSAYCGSLGYISCDGQMDTSIAIRSMICENNSMHCWAGGGIVADSVCESEYQECFTKVEKLFAALGHEQQ